jgi:hypothetical protein
VPVLHKKLLAGTKWRQIYIETSLPMGICSNFTQKLLAGTKWRQIYIETSLPMGICANFTQKIACRQEVAPDLHKNVLTNRKLCQFYTKNCLPARSGARFRENLLIVSNLCQICSRISLPTKEPTLVYPQEVVSDLHENVLTNKKWCHIYIKTSLSVRSGAIFT